MTDMAHVDLMIQAILRASHLSEETRIGYSKRLAHCNSSQEQSTATSVNPASTKSAELHLPELHRSWHPDNCDCSCPCCIQAAEPEGNKR